MAMKSKVLVDKAVDIAQHYKTLYVMGCFGAPMTAANKKRYTQNHSYNKAAARVAMINAATADTFGFDCVNLIKGILWGWTWWHTCNLSTWEAEVGGSLSSRPAWSSD